VADAPKVGDSRAPVRDAPVDDTGASVRERPGDGKGVGGEDDRRTVCRVGENASRNNRFAVGAGFCRVSVRVAAGAAGAQQAGNAAMMPPCRGVPPSGARLRIGLFGGSFNPPHAGHRHVAETAITRLGLDALWWMVTPGNPLKRHDDLADLPARLAAVASFARHPGMRVTAFEAAIRTRYSAEAIRYLTMRRPTVRFVWVIGADNLLTVHLWQEWRTIFAMVPVAVVSRPRAAHAAIRAPAARAFAGARIDEADAKRLAQREAPAWVFLNAPLKSVSSTDLRRAQGGSAPLS